jgi:hypothetical protein
VVAALVARELGGGRHAQALAALIVGFSPLLVATNGLFQPVLFDQLATMLVLWLVLRLLLGRGSWLAVGVAVGIGLETKYTLAVVVVLAAIAVAAWRRDVVGRGFVGELKPLAASATANGEVPCCRTTAFNPTVPAFTSAPGSLPKPSVQTRFTSPLFHNGFQTRACATLCKKTVKRKGAVSSASLLWAVTLD